jgi:hypothetical protein
MLLKLSVGRGKFSTLGLGEHPRSVSGHDSAGEVVCRERRDPNGAEYCELR